MGILVFGLPVRKVCFRAPLVSDSKYRDRRLVVDLHCELFVLIIPSATLEQVLVHLLRGVDFAWLNFQNKTRAT